MGSLSPPPMLPDARATKVAPENGSTNDAMARATTVILRAVAADTRTVLPPSVQLEGFLGVGDVDPLKTRVDKRTGEIVWSSQLHRERRSDKMTVAANIFVGPFPARPEAA